MLVTELMRYPVKSLGGERQRSLPLDRWGPVGDRRWAVIDADGRLKTARVWPEMLLLGAAVTPDGVRLTDTRDGESVEVATPVDGPAVDVNISRQSTALDAGDDAATFISAALGKPARLVWQPDPEQRSVNPDNGGLTGETLSLADAGPLLVTSLRSLERLHEWVGSEPEITMERFRPNVVIDGSYPFEEDDWRQLTIGGVRFRVQELCDRCQMTTVDPLTAQRTGAEPLAALREHHMIGRKMMFGIRVVPLEIGTISVGDAVAATGDAS